MLNYILKTALLKKGCVGIEKKQDLCQTPIRAGFITIKLEIFDLPS